MDPVAKRLNYEQDRLSAYRSILRKFQADHLGTYEQELENRLRELESNSERDEQYLPSQRIVFAEDYQEQELRENLSGIKAIDESQLSLEDIITNIETLTFMVNNFEGRNRITLKDFTNTIISLCELNFDERRYKIFKALMKHRLITTSSSEISINALEVNTKDKGIYLFIEEMVRQTNQQAQSEKQKNVNDEIANELMAVTEIIEQKKRKLAIEQAALHEQQNEIQKQRNSLCDQITKHYEVQMKVLDEQMNQKVQALNKRFHVIEHQLKQKLKLIESKGQVISKRNQSNQSDVEKLKSKIFSLEKQLELYKQKSNDLEKKLAQEKELTATAQAKADRFMNKAKTLENSLKETTQSQIIQPLTQSNLSEIEKKNESKTDISVDQKDKDKKIKKIVPKVTPQEDETVKQLLSFLEGFAQSISQFKRSLGIHHKTTDSQLIGEIMYPQFGSLLPALIEIVPTVFQKSLYNQHSQIVSQLLLDSLSFVFNLKYGTNSNTMVPINDLDKMRQKQKTYQEHVNEVMQQGQSKNFEICLLGQTQFWKKKLKAKSETKPQTQQKCLLHLLQSYDLQIEVIAILKQYLSGTESQVKRKIQEQTSFEVSAQKVSAFGEKKILVTRANLCCLILLLGYDQKDIALALKNITYDLRNENENLSQYLKSYLIEIGVASIIVQKIKEDLKDMGVIIPSTELVLELCSKGPHYDQIIKQLQPHILILSQILVINLKDEQFCEDLSIIIQRVLSTEGTQPLSQQDLNKIESKLNELQGKNLFLLESNLKSILSLSELNE